MDHPEQLESDTIVTAEIHGQRRSAAAATQTHSRVIPLRVGDLTRRHVEL